MINRYNSILDSFRSDRIGRHKVYDTSSVIKVVLYHVRPTISSRNHEIAGLERIAEKFRFFGYFLGICVGFLRRFDTLNGCQHYKHMSFDLGSQHIHGSAMAFRFCDRFHGARRVTLMLTYLPSQLLVIKFYEDT